jgi:acyl-CoA dehydrogenase
VPIGITVEGANILTRSMIIYGQGAIRCHPFVQEEMRAVAEDDLARFDRAFFGHVNHVARVARAAWCSGSRTGGWPAPAGRVRGCGAARLPAPLAPERRLRPGVRRLHGHSRRPAQAQGEDQRAAGRRAGLALPGFGHREALQRRRRPRARRAALARWAIEHARLQVQEALRGVLDNLPLRPAAWLVRCLVFPLGARHRPPDDALGSAVARSLLEDRACREHLTADIYVPPRDEPGLGRLEAALEHAVAALAVEAKVRDAVREGRLDKAPGDELLDRALEAGIISVDERKSVMEADEARSEVIQVDAFDPEVFRNLR